MNRFLVFICLIFYVLNTKAQVNCYQGDQNPPGQNDHTQHPLDDTTTSGGISADPNEFIGPAGYDSIRWVSINDVLNYTILVENDPEFA